MCQLAERGKSGAGAAADLVEQRLARVRARQSWAFDRQRADGSFMFITGHELPDGGYVFTFTDVTERVEAAQRLEQLVDERTHQYRLAKDEAVGALAQATRANEALSVANHRIGQSLAYARRIQSSMLPDPAT